MLQTIISDWSTFNGITALGVLIAYAFVDAMYARYTIQVVEARAAHAATTGALMHILMAFGVLSYVQNVLYVVPIVIGSWVGTYVTVRRGSR
jgi:hypothetical protein